MNEQVKRNAAAKQEAEREAQQKPLFRVEMTGAGKVVGVSPVKQKDYSIYCQVCQHKASMRWPGREGWPYHCGQPMVRARPAHHSAEGGTPEGGTAEGR